MRAVEVEVSDGLTLRADRTLLDRALGKLVDDAVRYGAGTITFAQQVPPHAAAILTVHDEGPGIPPHFLKHAAERFRQDQPAPAGLGLSLVDAIATARRPASHLRRGPPSHVTP